MWPLTKVAKTVERIEEAIIAKRKPDMLDISADRFANEYCFMHHRVKCENMLRVEYIDSVT